MFDGKVLAALSLSVCLGDEDAAKVGALVEEVGELRAEVERLRGMLDDVKGSMLFECRRIDEQLSPTSATACVVDVYSSRMCERGTKSCTVEHRSATPGGNDG